MITYRQAEYIGEALRSVLAQETDFRFEVVLSDDHSTDGTDEVIRETLRDHPRAGWVRYIRRERTLGMIANGLDNLRRCRGDWIALCEGDDVWTDPAKLSLQLAALGEHPGCDLCFHPASVYFGRQRTPLVYGFQALQTRVFSTREVLRGGCDFCPTASVLFRREVLARLPSFYGEAPVGDYFLKVLASVRGGALYLDRTCSVYRRNLEQSWTSSTQSLERRERFFDEFTRCLLLWDSEWMGRWSRDLAHERQRQYLDIAYNCLLSGDEERYGRVYRKYRAQSGVGLGMAWQHALGAWTGSAVLFQWATRLFFERPGPLRRAWRKVKACWYRSREERRLRGGETGLMGG
jgi:glycosyltransferase involved in cell wall biosynthesis